MKKEKNIAVNSLSAWVKAARPQTLVGAAVPVLMGGSMAFAHDAVHFSWELWVLCLLFALLMQVDANLVNDYYDFKRGQDDAETRLGPPRACAMGWITPKAMAMGVVWITLLAVVVGLVVMLLSAQWWLLWVGAASVLGCFLYTLCLAGKGWGDVMVILFFGLVPVMGTYFVALMRSPFSSLGGLESYHVALVALSCGFATDALLVVNNYRDVEQDRQHGKKTLVVMLGWHGGQLLYLLTGVLAMVMLLPLMPLRPTTWLVLALTYGVKHWYNYKNLVMIGEGKALNRVLAGTSMGIVLMGLFFSITYVLETYWLG